MDGMKALGATSAASQSVIMLSADSLRWSFLVEIKIVMPRLARSRIGCDLRPALAKGIRLFFGNERLSGEGWITATEIQKPLTT